MSALFLPLGHPALRTLSVNHSQISLMANIQHEKSVFLRVPTHCVVLCKPMLEEPGFLFPLILPSQPQGTTLNDVLTVTGLDGDPITALGRPQGLRPAAGEMLMVLPSQEPLSLGNTRPLSPGSGKSICCGLQLR